jgi:hypothetical protein
MVVSSEEVTDVYGPILCLVRREKWAEPSLVEEPVPGFGTAYLFALVHGAPLGEKVGELDPAQREEVGFKLRAIMGP